jgi:hypothetical protein
VAAFLGSLRSLPVDVTEMRDVVREIGRRDDTDNLLAFDDVQSFDSVLPSQFGRLLFP